MHGMRNASVLPVPVLACARLRHHPSQHAGPRSRKHRAGCSHIDSSQDDRERLGLDRCADYKRDYKRQHTKALQSPARREGRRTLMHGAQRRDTGGRLRADEALRRKVGKPDRRESPRGLSRCRGRRAGRDGGREIGRASCRERVS